TKRLPHGDLNTATSHHSFPRHWAVQSPPLVNGSASADGMSSLASATPTARLAVAGLGPVPPAIRRMVTGGRRMNGGMDQKVSSRPIDGQSAGCQPRAAITLLIQSSTLGRAGCTSFRNQRYQYRSGERSGGR